MPESVVLTESVPVNSSDFRYDDKQEQQAWQAPPSRARTRAEGRGPVKFVAVRAHHSRPVVFVVFVVIMRAFRQQQQHLLRRSLLCLASLGACLASHHAVVHAQQQQIDWSSSPSYELELSQKVSTISRFEGMRTNVGDVPPGLAEAMEAQLDREVRTFFPIKVTVAGASDDGAPAGLVNVTVDQLSPEMWRGMLGPDGASNNLAAPPGEPSLSLGVRNTQGEAAPPAWIAYYVNCTAQADDAVTARTDAASSAGESSSRCVRYNRDFVESVFPSYVYFEQLACGAQEPQAMWKEECEEWMDNGAGVLRGTACAEGAAASAALRPGALAATVGGMDIEVRDGPISTEVLFAPNGASGYFVDVRSTSDRETIAKAAMRREDVDFDAEVELTIESTNVYDAFLRFRAAHPMDDAQAQAIVRTGC